MRDGVWWMAAIEPPDDPGRGVGERSKRAAKRKTVLTLPKGLVDPGEKPLEAALREVYEETGVTAAPITKLGDSKYVYTRAWGRSGRINDISPEMRVEVERARWVRLEDAPTLLAYKGEKQMAQRALEYVQAHADL
jgi:8-oxo-dGTP pyrophosphatase MutT (NUDIX family)